MSYHRPRLEQLARNYLLSPASSPWYAEHDIGGGLLLIMALVSLAGACCMLPTIVLTGSAIAILRHFFSGKLMQDVHDEIRNAPEKVDFLVAQPVMSGSQGFSLVLASHDLNEPPADLQRVAAELFRIYKAEHVSSEETALQAFVRDDQFKPGRKRTVPNPLGGNGRYFVFDELLKPEYVGPGGVVMAAAKNDDGTYRFFGPLPWDAVQDAFEAPSEE